MVAHTYAQYLCIEIVQAFPGVRWQGGGVLLVARVLLALFLLVAGVGHLVAVEEFLGQVPTFLPLREEIVVVSGLVEIGLAVALVGLRGRRLALLGWGVAGFFVAIFPGNLWQLVEGSDSFGLDTTQARVVRLFFQPLFVVWALWCTGAWGAWRAWRARRTT
jgi:uncharacterized membrane protein